MEYLSKVKNASLKAAQQGYNLIQTVTTAAQDMAAPTFQSRKPVDDFLLRFQTVCQTLDNLARMDNSGTADGEKLLNDSKVRDHIKEMLRHLQLEDKQWVGAHVKCVGDDEIREQPCLEVFLQNHVMEELCSRAKRDKPRGSLPFVLAFATSVLRVLRYPLLPHQTVHTSLCQLIVNASTISSKYSAIAKGKGQSTAEIVGYVKKIDMNLVALIHALWKRIAENPELLTFFRFVDTRENAKVRQHLYAITHLIPLMGKPRVGLAAKEALLLAVSMHDKRVDEFIILETNLAKNIVSELCKKFDACVTSTASVNSLVPMTSGTRRDVNSSTNSLAGGAPTKPVTVDSFIRVLRFCAAFVAAASSEAVVEDESLRSSICSLFEQQFLVECVKSHLLENGEQHVLAAQSLCSYILQEISSPGRGKYADQSSSATYRASSSMHTLRPLTTRLLCSDSDILQAFLPRVGSVSRAVSISTMQLLSTLLESCGLEEAKHLVCACSPNASDVKSYEDIDTLSLVRRALDRGAAVCESSVWIYKVTAESMEATSGYRDAAMSRILRLLTGSFTAHHTSPQTTASEERGFISGSLFELTLRKLRLFLTLKYDEQVAVTGLVERCITVFAVLAVQAGEDAAISAEYTSKIVEMSECSCDLIDQLSSHLNKIADCESKITAVRSVLVDPQGVDQRSRKIIDSENQQVLRILETGVLIRELFCEIEGGLLAIEHLSGMLHGDVADDSVDLIKDESHQIHKDVFFNDDNEEDDDEDESCSDGGDFDMSVSGLGELGNLISEETFLSACAGLEESLEDILRANEMGRDGEVNQVSS